MRATTVDDVAVWAPHKPHVLRGTCFLGEIRTTYADPAQPSSIMADDEATAVE